MRALLLAFALSATPAAAVSFDPGTPGPAYAEASVEVDSVVTTSYGFGTYTVGNGSVTITAAPVAAVTASAKTLAGSTTAVGANGLLNYEYLVKVAASGTAQNTILNLVTIKGLSTFDASTNTFGYVQAFSGAGEGTAQQYYEDAMVGAGPYSAAFQMGGAGRYEGTITENGADLFVYRGTFGLFAGGRALAGGGNVTVTIDPLFSVNSAALQDAGLNGPATVELSPGISNAAAVPEPANWALMIAGFGLLGSVRRRRIAFA